MLLNLNGFCVVKGDVPTFLELLDGTLTFV